MVIVYCEKWRWIPVHNVYWSNSNFRTATCIMTTIHSRTDKITQCVSVQSSLHFIPNNTHNSLRSSVNPLFDSHGLLITFICFFSVSVLYFLIQFSYIVFPQTFPELFFFLSTSTTWLLIDFTNICHSIRTHYYCNITHIASRVYFFARTKSHWFSFSQCSLQYIGSNNNACSLNYSKF